MQWWKPIMTAIMLMRIRTVVRMSLDSSLVGDMNYRGSQSFRNLITHFPIKCDYNNNNNHLVSIYSNYFNGIFSV